MNLTDKLESTSSARLADRIKITETELGKLVTAHDQAESDAVSKAGEDVAYQKAAARAADLSRQVAEKRERLERLRVAHEAALDREQGELIDELHSKQKELASVLDKTKAEVDRLRAAEDERHKQKIAVLDRRLGEAELAEAEAAIAAQEEEIKKCRKHIATAEADGDSNELMFAKRSLPMCESMRQSALGRRGNATRRISGEARWGQIFNA